MNQSDTLRCVEGYRLLNNTTLLLNEYIPKVRMYATVVVCNHLCVSRDDSDRRWMDGVECGAK
jgi:hypothetical protein